MSTMLAPEHSKMVGAAILDRLEETFGGTGSEIPKIQKNSRPDAVTLLAALAIRLATLAIRLTAVGVGLAMLAVLVVRLAVLII